MLTYPPDFLWGISTAAHQFEGDEVSNQWCEWDARDEFVPDTRADWRAIGGATPRRTSIFAVILG